MDKQKIIASVNPKKKKTNRKEAATKIREQSFQQAYQKNQEEEIKNVKHQENSSEAPVSMPSASIITTLPEPNKQAEAIPEHDQQESLPQKVEESLPEQKTTARRGAKKGKKKDGVGDTTYATISVHQNVSKVVKLASTMLEENKLDFTTDAIRHYIKHLKKAGKLPDMPSLDL